MKTDYYMTRAGIGVLFCLLIWTVSSRAQSAPSDAVTAPSPEEVVKLPAFSVSDSSVDQFNARDVQSVARVAASIMDTPLSVNVVTPALLQDIGAEATFDVTRYFAGVSPGRGNGVGGIQDRQDFRGFENFSKTIDNFSSFTLPEGTGYNATFDPVFIETAELVMGPDSILSPTGTPGGSINIITKSPKFNQATEMSVEVGNYNAQRVTFDNTGSIGNSKHWAYRVIGSAQDTQTFVPGRVDTYNGSAQIEYVFSPTAKATFKYFGEFWEEQGSIANANDNGEQVWAPNTVMGTTLSNSPQPGWTYQSDDGNATWTDRIERLNIFEAELTAALGEHINMRFGANISFDTDYYYAAYPRSAPAETFDPATGQEIAVASINPASVPIVGVYAHLYSRQLQFQNDYAANYQFGSVSLKPVVGWASQVGRTVNFQLNDNSTSDLPNANIAVPYAPPPPPLSDFTAVSAIFPEDASLFQGYGLVTAGFFHDRVFLMGGASRTWATVNDYSFKGRYIQGIGNVGAAPGTANYLQDFTFQNTGNAVAPTQKDYHDTDLAGVLVKVLENVSLYGSSSTNAGITASNPLWQSGKQYEFGVKSELFNKQISISADHFQISESNIAIQNPLYNAGLSNVAILLSNQTNHGEEFNIVGAITRNLSVIGSFTEMKLRDVFGRRQRNIPDTMANLLLDYRFTDGSLKNFAAFVGVVHEGDVAGETVTGSTALGVPEQPGFYLPAWSVVNAGISYPFGRYRFSLNVDNVLNSHFYWQPAGRISVSPYETTTFRFTSSVHF